MPKTEDYKLRILYLLEYLMRNSDESHPKSVSDILGYFSSIGISVNRKTVYDDVNVLQSYGYDIEIVKGHFGGYYIASRIFELSEIKMLVDAVTSAKFITNKKSSQIIGKLSSLVSVYDEKELERNVYVTDRSKVSSESVFYSIDTIHNAISNNKCVTFKYYQWHLNYSVNNNITLTEKHNNHIYCVSPYELVWDDEQYYLVAYDNDEGILKHFRIDKMKDTSISDVGIERDVLLKKPDVKSYSKKVFGMFGGNEERVTLRFDSSLIGAVADRFGSDSFISKCNDSCFDITVNVSVSPQFFAYITAFADKATIISPETVVEKYKEHLNKTLNQYNAY